MGWGDCDEKIPRSDCCFEIRTKEVGEERRSVSADSTVVVDTSARAQLLCVRGGDSVEFTSASVLFITVSREE